MDRYKYLCAMKHGMIKVTGLVSRASDVELKVPLP